MKMFEELKCPLCNGRLVYVRSVGYPSSNKVYMEFDCESCDYVGRIFKGTYFYYRQ